MSVSLPLKRYLPISLISVPVPDKVDEPERWIQQQESNEAKLTPLQVVNRLMSLGCLSHFASGKHKEAKADRTDFDRRHLTQDHGYSTVFFKNGETSFSSASHSYTVGVL